MDKHFFAIEGTWAGGLAGQGNIETGKINFEVSAPAELGGNGTGTNPEEMLLSSAATCYLITLGSLLERRKWVFEEISIRSEATINIKGGLKFESILHKPFLKLNSEVSLDEKEEIRKIAMRAEQVCMITKALSGNVEFKVEPEIV